MANDVAERSVYEYPTPCKTGWADLVDQVRRNDPAGLEELYRVFGRVVRFRLCRHLGPQDLDDHVHDAFLAVTKAIRLGQLREPERLMGYVRTIVRRHVMGQVGSKVFSREYQRDLDAGLPVCDRASSPEQLAIRNENWQLAAKVLKGLAPRDREILVRFYLSEQSADQICKEMGLSTNQFRRIKSCAKAHFGVLGNSLQKKRLPWGFRRMDREDVPDAA